MFSFVNNMRKYYIVFKKLSIILVAVLAVFYLYRWLFTPTPQPVLISPSHVLRTEEQLEEIIRKEEARVIPHWGRGGQAVPPRGLGAPTHRDELYYSDRIPYDRSVRDLRPPGCRLHSYDHDLPTASVLIVFRNEPHSLLVRTVTSVLKSYKRYHPGKHLHEVLLVDDASRIYHTPGKLARYIRTRLPPIVRLIRLNQPIGVVRARQLAARNATGDVIVHLDAHCEVGIDWLRPLLQRLKERPDIIVTPVIDVITPYFEYTAMDADRTVVGSFDFNLNFIWKDAAETKDATAPLASPTLAGGLYAVTRELFWRLGGYDEDMEAWGGENLELSFRAWSCGGAIETLPCSRAGHLFRPYAAHPERHLARAINVARVADVWLDEYRALFMLHEPHASGSALAGDVTARRALRERLNCQPFRWYMETVHPDKFIPMTDARAWGRLRTSELDLCADSGVGYEGLAKVTECLEPILGGQLWALDEGWRLRSDERCAVVAAAVVGAGYREIVLQPCFSTRGGQAWRLVDSRLIHEQSKLCLDSGWLAGGDLTAMACDDATPSQRWHFDFHENRTFEKYNFFDALLFDSHERLAALQALAGARRAARGEGEGTTEHSNATTGMAVVDIISPTDDMKPT